MIQSALDPHGPEAATLAKLIWLFVAVCGVVWALVLIVLALAIRCRHMQPSPNSERRATFAVGSAIAATVLILIGFTAASFITTRDVSASAADPLTVKVRGEMWWWQITYPDPNPERSFQTANEVHIPVGRPVRFELTAEDVIHSFWIPPLGGKQDLIPGRNNAIVFTADHPGTYRGQCAEFCGLQHAHMALLVIAEPADVFDQWRASQRANAAGPTNAEQELGRRIIETRQCAACHVVRGTKAVGNSGPDLTHVGSRQLIAAGVTPNTRGSLAAWIADPQTVKPGNNMPLVPLQPDELRAVSAYLASLK